MNNISKNTCIVIGNGPSLRGFDLHRLRGFTTLGMNAAYRHWDRIGWYPTYYACLDDQLIKTHHAEIERLYATGLVKKVFVHGGFFEYYPHRLKHPDFTSFDQTAEYWFNKNGKELGLEPLFDRIAFRMSDKSKVTTGAHSVRYAANLGHDQVVLLGIDLRYVEILPEAQPTSDIGLVMKTTPKQNPNYFFDGYQKAGDLYNIPNPAAHNGELHPRSFELIPKDFAANRVPCRVYNANQNSILSDRNILPFIAIEEVLSESLLGSVMVPCNKSEIDAIVANIELWNRLDFCPGLHEMVKHKPALVFVFNNISARPEQERISRAFTSNDMGRFFSEVCFEYLDLDGEHDLYIRDYTKPVGDQGYKAGPNNQFFAAIRLMAKYGYYTFLMETDCLPIRRGWLTRLQGLVDKAEPFWVMGSSYRGSTQLSIDFVRHINGNAVYAVGDQDFQKFVSDFWEPHTRSLVRDKDKRLAYDCILEIMFSEANIRDPKVMNTWKHSAHKFHYFDFLQNISAKEDIANADESLIANLRLNSPNTYILHNRKVHEIVLAQLAEGRFEQIVHKGGACGYPRLLLIDFTPVGNGTATGEIKSSFLANWPGAALLQIAQHQKDGLAIVRREDMRYVVKDYAESLGVDKINIAVRQAIDAFSPDVVLYRPTPNTDTLHCFAMNEIARLNKPLVTWIMDDWPARMAAEEVEAWNRMEPDLMYLLRASVTRMSISESMSEAFTRRYGVPFKPLANGIDPADWLPVPKPQREKFVLRYAGGLASDMSRDSLLRVAAAVESLANMGTKIQFEISSQSWWIKECKEIFARFPATQLSQSDRTIVDYRRWLAEADALLIDYNFDERSMRYIRYSIANKMPECLASGAALLVHGPRDTAVVDYLTQAEVAKVVNTPDKELLINALAELVDNAEYRNTLAEAGRQLAFAEHNIHRLRATFLSILNQAAETLALNAPNRIESVPAISAVPNFLSKDIKSVRLELLSFTSALLQAPIAALGRLRADRELFDRLSKSLAMLPEDSPLKITFRKAQARAEVLIAAKNTK